MGAWSPRVPFGQLQRVIIRLSIFLLVKVRSPVRWTSGRSQRRTPRMTPRFPKDGKVVFFCVGILCWGRPYVKAIILQFFKNKHIPAQWLPGSFCGSCVLLHKKFIIWILWKAPVRKTIQLAQLPQRRKHFQTSSPEPGIAYCSCCSKSAAPDYTLYIRRNSPSLLFWMPHRAPNPSWYLRHLLPASDDDTDGGLGRL